MTNQDNKDKGIVCKGTGYKIKHNDKEIEFGTYIPCKIVEAMEKEKDE